MTCTPPRNDLFLSLIREASALGARLDRRDGWMNATSLVDIVGGTSLLFDERVRAHLFGEAIRDDDGPSSSSSSSSSSGGGGGDRVRRSRPDIDAMAAASDGVVVVGETTGEGGAGGPAMVPWWRDEVDARWAGPGEAGGGDGGKDDDRRERGSTTNGGGRAYRGSEMRMVVHSFFLLCGLHHG